jgi:hypothetical protein
MAITEEQAIGAGANPTLYSTPFRATTPGIPDAIDNQAEYYFGSIVERARQIAVYGTTIEPGFDYTKNIPKGFEDRPSLFATAVNANHAEDMASSMRRRDEVRSDMGRTPVGVALVAEFFNPINFIPIPIGIVGNAARLTVAKVALRGGAATGAIEAGANIAIMSTDPTQTLGESFMNTASATIFGGATAGLFSVPAISKKAALDRSSEQASAVFKAGVSLESLGVASAGAFERYKPRDQRFFGSSDNIETSIDLANEQIAKLELQLRDLPEGSRNARLIREEIEKERAYRQDFADEFFYRKVEEAGVKLDDIYRPADGLDNIFIRAVPSPFRSVLFDNFGKANNTIKKAFVSLVADGGTQLRAHDIGQAVPLSVHQQHSQDMGEFARYYGESLALWAQDTGAPMPGGSVLSNPDVNMTSVTRRLAKSGGSIDEWMTEVSRKRLSGEKMTPAQEQAAKLIDEYTTKWEQRSVETEQLRAKSRVEKRLKDLEAKAEKLRSLVRAVEEGGGTPKPEKVNELSGLEKDIESVRFERDNLFDEGAAEPFFSRYWNKGAIKKNREKLKQALIEWYTEKPYIIRFVEGENDEPGKWTRIDLETSPASIAKRADETIENILNENDGADSYVPYTGKGRPSALAGRTLDIPNSRVLDFIELNPVNVLGNYTMRTGPKYHFAKQFGANRAQVVKNMREEMQKAGVSEKKIDQTMMRFNHLYDRVVGRVAQNPEAWNQKIAATLRDMASLTYLGGAGIAAVGDLGRIVMEHEGQTIIRGAEALLNPVIRKASRHEVRVAGGALDMLLGSVFMRMMDDQNYNLLNNGIMDRAKNVFFTMNLLGPVTVTAKQFSGALAGHNFIELAQKVVTGNATDFDIRYLARHGIDVEFARRIASAPFQVDKKTGFILPNTDGWTKEVAFTNGFGDRVDTIDLEADGVMLNETMNRDELVRYINGQNVDIDVSNLVFHVTDNADEIIANGFQRGGATFGRPINEIGYGNVVTVFDVSNLDMKGIPKSGIEADASWLLRGQKPVAVIHAAEAPNYWGGRQFGARSAELDIEQEAQWFNALEAAYLRGEDITKLPEFDELGILGYSREDAPDLIDEFERQFSNISKYSSYGSGEKLDSASTKGAVYMGSDGKLRINRDYINDVAFPEMQWTKGKDVAVEIKPEMQEKAASEFASKPWTKPPYKLPANAIKTEEEWAKFLTLREMYLNQATDVKARPQSLLSLSNDELVELLGKEFGVDKIITDPAVLAKVPEMNGEKSKLIGFHRYSFVTSRGPEGGTVYLNLEEARRFYSEVHGQKKDAKKALADLYDQLVTGDIDPVRYQHLRAQYENVDLFEDFNDFAEFLLFHELHHGPTRQDLTVVKRYGEKYTAESVAQYEQRIDDLAIQSLKDRKANKNAAFNSVAATSVARQALTGGAMKEGAFKTPEAYTNFLGFRAILEDDKKFSFKYLGLSEKSAVDVFRREALLNREAMRRVESAGKVQEETVQRFRTAVNTAINNTVMMATAADKPIMMDGVIYVRQEIGDRLGLDRDPRNPGYSRIENAFIALPLQFYQYSLANVSKTVGLMMQGAVRSRVAGVAAMMGLGYMVTSIRTPDYVWDQMSIQDKVGRSFDMSGVAALYSDLFYTALQTSLAVGGPNLTGGLIQPRFPQQPNAIDAVTGITGAATSWTADMGRSAVAFASGNFGEGAGMFINNLPFSNLFFIRGEVNEIARTLSRP